MKNTKKRFVPNFPTEFASSEDFESLLNEAQESQVKAGEVVKGTVVGSNKDIIIVDVGLKNEGRIPISEFHLAVGAPLPAVGELVDVYVEKIEGRNGRTVISREKALREESWGVLEQLFDKGELVDGVIFGRVKGGFTVDLSGVVAFLPGSQVDVRPVKDITPLMGIVQPFQILKMDKKLGNIVVSRRAILEESRSEARDEMLATIKEGMTLDGVVKNITDYGAFIDLGSVDGLLHVTDISWSRINHPSEILSLGQQVKVMVIKFNEENKRISLGMKQLDDNPWQNIQTEFPVGSKLKGKVTNIADYGAFIELKDGIEGLVHASEITWVKSNQHPKKILTIGQEVEFVILEVDTDKHRISLSIKQCQDNPWEKFAAENQIGTVIKVPVRNVTDFGLFVAIGNEIDGMIHESDLSWDHSVKPSAFNKDDEIECKVLAIDPVKERVSLGVKQLTDDPHAELFSNISKGSVVTCVITDVKEDGLEVTVNDAITGFIKRTDLASERTEQKTERFAAGERVDAKVVNIDKAARKVALSVKALEQEARDKAIKEYGSTDSGASLGDILGAALNESSEDKK